MKNQVIITISREYGSAGHFIAQKLAEKLNVTLYDKQYIEDSYEQIGFPKDVLNRYDEKPRNILFSRRVGRHSSSIEDHVQQKVADFLVSKADAGESFVIVGRCADSIFREHPNAVRVFVMGDKEDKIKRIMELYELDRDSAIEKMKRHDKKRRQYHNTYSKIKWGDSRGYHVCINSAAVGIDKTVDILCDYVKGFMA